MGSMGHHSKGQPKIHVDTLHSLRRHGHFDMVTTWAQDRPIQPHHHGEKMISHPTRPQSAPHLFLPLAHFNIKTWEKKELINELEIKVAQIQNLAFVEIIPVLILVYSKC